MVLLNREIRLFCFPFVFFCLPFVSPVFYLPAFRYGHESVRNVGFDGVCEPEEPSLVVQWTGRADPVVPGGPSLVAQ